MLLEVQCEFPQSVMIWAAMSSAGVGPLCFLKSQSTQPSTRNFLDVNLMFIYQVLSTYTVN